MGEIGCSVSLGPVWSGNAFPGDSTFLCWAVHSGPSSYPKSRMVGGITPGVFLLFHNNNNNISWASPRTKTWISQRCSWDHHYFLNEPL